MKKFKDDIRELLVQLFFELEGRKPERLMDHATAQGKQVELEEDTVLIKHRGFICSLKLGSNQIEQVETLMYALIGPMWPMLFNDVYQLAVNDIKNKKEEAIVSVDE